MSWLGGRVQNTEEGAEQWKRVVEWIETPPPTRAAPTRDVVRPVRPAALPAGAPITPHEQAAAFSAFMTAGG